MQHKAESLSTSYNRNDQLPNSSSENARLNLSLWWLNCKEFDHQINLYHWRALDALKNNLCNSCKTSIRFRSVLAATPTCCGHLEFSIPLVETQMLRDTEFWKPAVLERSFPIQVMCNIKRIFAKHAPATFQLWSSEEQSWKVAIIRNTFSLYAWHFGPYIEHSFVYCDKRAFQLDMNYDL